MNNDPINVDRRRKGSGPVGRADAPQRDLGGGQGSGFPSSGGNRPLFGGMPPRGAQLGGCGGLLVLLLAVAYFFLSGGQGVDLGTPSDQSGGQDYGASQPTEEPLPASNFTPPVPAASSGQNWTILLYQDADDQVLEHDVYLDLNEAERVGSSKNVNVVAQIDRFQGAFQGDGNWSSTRRYYVTQDNDLNRIHSQLVQDLGEADMSSSQTLADFVEWAVKSYPASHYVLILSDHGMGWPGGWSDPDPGGRDDSGVPLTRRLGRNLFLMQLDEALQTAQAQAGLGKFDIVGLDACLMSQLEVMAALQPHADYAVASEETEPGIGWAYAGFLGALVSNPDMTPADLSKLMVQSYIQDDQRLLDPAARAEFLRGGSPLGGYLDASSASSAQLTAEIGHDATLASLDLSALPGLMDSFNAFSYQLQNDNQQLVAEARNYAQSYTSLFGREVPPSYIDLGNFVLLMRENTSEAGTQRAADAVVAALQKVVIAEKHGPGKKGSTGLAIYFPNSTLYSSPISGPASYTALAKRFASESLWDDFLAFHYMDRNFDETAAAPYVPSGGYTTRAPGLGQFTVSDIRASSNEAVPNQPVQLSVDISGNNVGYIYLFVGYYDSSANSINVTDTDYLESPQSKQVGGVYYPAWKEGGFTMNFKWDPVVFGISDGTQDAVALFQPVQYGASSADAEYTVEGLYTFAESGEQRYAQLHFRNEALTEVVGFNSETDLGAPREITPSQGDTFTIYEKWMDLDANGNISGVVKENGKTLTFGAQPFKWVQLYAAQGDYVVGFIVTDLDGNQYPVYTNITVH
ncbi:MAG TPA: clostripain-related cysteine peptidase [Anaerolineales bacterium]|nr:clostripain-related cysteine peptidase [Anaerolineales bacterium]